MRCIIAKLQQIFFSCRILKKREVYNSDKNIQWGVKLQNFNNFCRILKKEKQAVNAFKFYHIPNGRDVGTIIVILLYGQK